VEYIEKCARRQGKKWFSTELEFETEVVGEFISPNIQYVQWKCLHLSPSLSAVSAAKRQEETPQEGYISL